MSDKPIDPGPGWRLLEPGEVIREGDEFAFHDTLIEDPDPAYFIPCNHAGVTVEQLRGSLLHRGGEVVRRRISPASQWTPVSEQPLPESGSLLLQFDNGDMEAWLDDIPEETRRVVIAWMPLPEPFVPPEPVKREQEQERRRLWIGYGHDGKPLKWFDEEPFLLLPEHGFSDCAEHREHRPGDVDPDAAIRARETCKGIIAGSPTPTARTVAASDILAILNGDDQCCA